MTITIRWTVGRAYVVAERVDDGPWTVSVTDALSRPIAGDERVRALEQVNTEVSSLRAHIWHNELGRT